MNALRLAFLIAAVGAAGCAHAPREPLGAGTGPPAADSATVALWRMDEQAGTRIGDSGPSRLDGTAGRSVQHLFGRFGGALGLERSLDSFGYVPFDPALDTGAALTVEAWIFPTAFGLYEDTPIAGRWTEEPYRQSWLFSLSGRRLGADVPGVVAPGYHRNLFPDLLQGKLLFAFQPEVAAPPRSYFSNAEVELDRWTHVAATFDGQVVRLYIDGELDSQFASLGRIRNTEAPLLIGNYFDVRLLTGFGGDLHPNLIDPTAYYAFQGRVDELRLSRTARTEFPVRAPR